jgi:hypothetical protein
MRAQKRRNRRPTLPLPSGAARRRLRIHSSARSSCVRHQSVHFIAALLSRPLHTQQHSTTAHETVKQQTVRTADSRAVQPVSVYACSLPRTLRTSVTSAVALIAFGSSLCNRLIVLRTESCDAMSRSHSFASIRSTDLEAAAALAAASFASDSTTSVISVSEAAKHLVRCRSTRSVTSVRNPRSLAAEPVTRPIAASSAVSSAGSTGSISTGPLPVSTAICRRA